jgi:hypothetical protein
MIVIPNHWVTLHRVGTDSAGPLDSTRTSAAGTYAFTFRRTGAENAVYFVSASYGGVAYFTQPLPPGVTSGDDAEISVFDTTSKPVPMSVRGHHMVIGEPLGGGMRQVTEVYEIANDSSVTRVAANESADGAVWSAILPAGATQPSVGEGDIPAGAVRFDRGRALVYAPLAPGIKQFVMNYALPADAFPLALPLQHATSVMELLLEEPAASARGIREVRAVNVQGRQFRRYLAADMPASAVLTITVPESKSQINPWYMAGLTVVIGGAMTGALARAVRRR